MGSEYQDFQRIITGALRTRGDSESDFASHPEFGVPQYVVSMCEQLAGAIHSLSGITVQLQDLIRIEGTCTGVDYMHQLARRCHGLIATTNLQASPPSTDSGH